VAEGIHSIDGAASTTAYIIDCTSTMIGVQANGEQNCTPEFIRYGMSFVRDNAFLC
jgi:hypothetical protein